ncbi:hypothetical protein [Streptomyces sp. NRRL S-495]|uniref:hypothetical protein n=1 Tax=Streptomyces sp. NRRL S-495 TaxID=1609133 RepID=UPI0007C68E3D|nr:hypothetical protein [Streptomyces sp. NRRL S-495]
MDRADETVDLLLDAGREPGAVLVLTVGGAHPWQQHELSFGEERYWAQLTEGGDVFYADAELTRPVRRPVVVLVVNGGSAERAAAAYAKALRAARGGTAGGLRRRRPGGRRYAARRRRRTRSARSARLRPTLGSATRGGPSALAGPAFRPGRWSGRRPVR